MHDNQEQGQSLQQRKQLRRFAPTLFPSVCRGLYRKSETITVAIATSVVTTAAPVDTATLSILPDTTSAYKPNMEQQLTLTSWR